jgi:hypothetical protein
MEMVPATPAALLDVFSELESMSVCGAVSAIEPAGPASTVVALTSVPSMTEIFPPVEVSEIDPGVTVASPELDAAAIPIPSKVMACPAEISTVPAEPLADCNTTEVSMVAVVGSPLPTISMEPFGARKLIEPPLEVGPKWPENSTSACSRLP